jgi:hypothetical protein
LFFCLDYPVHRCLAQLLVVQRQHAFDQGRVLLADDLLSVFRRHRQGVFERRFSVFITLKGHLTKAHALKEVGHIHRTDQLVDLMPVPTVASASSQRKVVGE